MFKTPLQLFGVQQAFAKRVEYPPYRQLHQCQRESSSSGRKSRSLTFSEQDFVNRAALVLPIAWILWHPSLRLHICDTIIHDDALPFYLRIGLP